MPTKPDLRQPGTRAGAPAGPATTSTSLPGDLAIRRFGLPAAYWRRIVARLLDSLAVFWIEFALVVTGAAFWVRPLTARFNPGPWGDAFIATLTFAVFLVIYEVVFIAANGQTPGKDVLKLKVVSLADGKTPTVPQALRRSLVHATLAMVPNVWLATLAHAIDGVPALLSPGRRTVADRVAGTQVVFYDDPDRPRPSSWDRPSRFGNHLFFKR